MTAHNHAVYVEGCYRCDLNRDEQNGRCDYCGLSVACRCDRRAIWQGSRARAALLFALEAVYSGDQRVETDAVLDQLDSLGFRVVER